MRKQYHFFISVLCVLVFLLSGCGLSQSKVDSQEVVDTQDVTSSQEVEIRETAGREIQTAIATMMDIEKTKLYQARIAPSITELKFPQAGQFYEYEVDLGTSVKKGDVLAKTQEKVLTEEIERVEESIEGLKENYNNNVKHYETKIQILELELEDLTLDATMKLNKQLEKEKQVLLLTHEIQKYQLEKERLDKSLKDLKEQVGSNEIIAPHDGVVIYLESLYEGSYVNETTSYIALSDETSYTMVCDYISATSIEKQIRIYGVKDKKEYELTYEPMESEIFSKLTASGYGVYTTFRIDDPDDTLNYSDYSLIVSVSDEAKQILGIPKLAIRSDTVGKYVYLKIDGEKVKTYVKTGITDGVSIEITEGLKEGDIVYVEN